MLFKSFKHVSDFFSFVFVLLACDSIGGSEGKCENSKPFQIKTGHLNKQLTGHSLYEVSVAGHHDCARECFSVGLCRSIDYDSKDRTCKLNDVGSNTVNPGDFEPKLGAIFSDISEWPATMTGSCGQRPCASNEICVMTYDMYNCLRIECGKAPSVPNGKITLDQVGQTSFLDTATVTCDNGYSSDDVDSIRCQASGKWQQVRCRQVTRFVKTLTVSNGEELGSWSTKTSVCPHLQYAAGWNMKIQPSMGDGVLGDSDDTALNGVKIICKDLDGQRTRTFTSDVGPWGTWVEPVNCMSPDHILVSFSLQVEAKLIGHSLYEVSVAGHHDCARECFSVGLCRSIDYDSKDRTCKLNDVGSNTADPGDFETKLGAIFSDISEWPATMAGSCGQRPCASNEICVTTHDRYTCLRIECGKPPSIPNGKITLDQVRQTSFLDTATVTCDNGYSSDGVDSIKCQASGKWQQVRCRQVTRFVKTLTVSNGEELGNWSTKTSVCPHLQYAAGWNMKIQPSMGDGVLGDSDDTALNGVKIICKDLDGQRTQTFTSDVGPWGTWVEPVNCMSFDHILVSFSLQVEAKNSPTSDVGDYTSVNFIKFKCRDFAGVQPAYEVVGNPSSGERGTFGPWSEECPPNSAICSILTRVQPPMGDEVDDTALNDVMFKCCT